MFLLDQPYISEYLIETIQKNGFPVVSTPEARKMLQGLDLPWISEEQARSRIEAQPWTPVYSNSENALAWMAEQAAFRGLAEKVGLFKNKSRFRDLIRDLSPDFRYRTLSLEELEDMDAEAFGFPFVIKPSVGFFSLGVHIVKNVEDWDSVRTELNSEALQVQFPAAVLDTGSFIVEQYLEGEEYAVDCYFNTRGEVVVLGIFHHWFGSGADTSDRVYVTSREVIRSHEKAFTGYLNEIGKRAELKNFPAHVELRVDPQGQIRAVEVNPLRFGGFCTTADLAGINLGYNPYEYYIRQEKPQWDEVFRGREERIQGLVVLNNNSGYRPEEIAAFDYELLASDFSQVRMIRKLDIRTKPVFGFVFAESTPGKEKDLEAILRSDLRKYIRLKSGGHPSSK